MSIAASITPAEALTANHWELQVSALDADLSPDDRLVAITTQTPEKPEHGATDDNWVTLWNYVQKNEIAQARVSSASAGMRAEPCPVRFTSDGLFLVVGSGQKLDVLDATTLKFIREIQVPISPEYLIREIETSPVSHIAILVADKAGIYGALFAYDLDHGRGRELMGEVTGSAVTSLAWKPDGAQFAAAMPQPCSRWGDVEVFSSASWTPVLKWSEANVESLAFSDKKLYAVQMSFCKGVVFPRHLGIHVFDTQTKHKDKIFLPHTDIHDFVSYSNGRLLADTGTVRTNFDWLDMTSYLAEVGTHLTVWNTATGSVVYSSDLLELHGGLVYPSGRIPISRTGKMAIVLDAFVGLFQLP